MVTQFPKCTRLWMITNHFLLCTRLPNVNISLCDCHLLSVANHKWTIIDRPIYGLSAHYHLFFMICLPLEFLPVLGPLTCWCAFSLGSARLYSSRAGSDFGPYIVDDLNRSATCQHKNLVYFSTLCRHKLFFVTFDKPCLVGIWSLLRGNRNLIANI